MENKDIVKNMTKIIANLSTKQKFSKEYYRLLGGIEGMLICVGKLPLQGEFNYIEVPHTNKSFFGKETKTTRTESYNELVIRLVKEVIKENL